MSSLVLDLQRDVLNKDCDILGALRKAHVIATKLKLNEFDSWIMGELNGYTTMNAVPGYRTIRGQLRAYNPYRGWIPVISQNTEFEETMCVRKLSNSISEIIGWCNNPDKYLAFSYPGDIAHLLQKMVDAPFKTDYSLYVEVNQLRSIMDKVGNCLLEWTLRLEKDNILGDDMRFSQEEEKRAEAVPQQIHNYYGTVINGAIDRSAVVSGNDNSVTVNFNDISEILEKVKNSEELNDLSEEDKAVSVELIEDVEQKIITNKSSKTIRAAMVGLKDFLLNAGANAVGGMLAQWLMTHV